MPIDRPLADHDAALAALREQLGELQLPRRLPTAAARSSSSRSPGAGKKAALKQLAAAFDPCHFAVHDVLHDRRQASEGHWLARFWRQLPQAGDTAIFFRSRDRRVLDDRLLGRVEAKAVARAFDEINEFEAQQRDYGTLIVKLYFDVSAEVQERRLQEQMANPLAASGRQGRGGERQRPGLRQGAQGPACLLRHALVAVAEVLDGEDEAAATLAALTAVAAAWAEAMRPNRRNWLERRFAPLKPRSGNGSRPLRSFSRRPAD